MVKRTHLSIFLVPFIFAAAYCQPKISVVGQDTFKIGKIYNTGDHIVRSFQVTNTGDRILHIKGVRTSCGCTIALLSDSLIETGHNLQIRVDFNPAGYSGDVTKYVYVTSDDPVKPITTLVLQMDVAYALQANPNFILFENAKTGKPDTASLVLKNISDLDMEIVSVESSSGELTSNFKNVGLKPGESIRIELYFTGKKIGADAGMVSVTTTSKLQPKLEIRYYAGVN